MSTHANIQSNEDKSQDSAEVEFIADEEENTPEFHKKITKWKEDLQHCEMEKKEYLEGWQRAKADHINYKNEEGKRLEDMARFISSGLIEEFLPVLDSFDLALGHKLTESAEKGILLIRSQLEDILKKRGIKEIEVQLGDDLNPERHESIGEVESDKPVGTVAEVVQRGYTFRDRVLRPARVRLSKPRS